MPRNASSELKSSIGEIGFFTGVGVEFFEDADDDDVVVDVCIAVIIAVVVVDAIIFRGAFDNCGELFALGRFGRRLSCGEFRRFANGFVDAIVGGMGGGKFAGGRSNLLGICGVGGTGRIGLSLCFGVANGEF